MGLTQKKSVTAEIPSTKNKFVQITELSLHKCFLCE